MKRGGSSGKRDFGAMVVPCAPHVSVELGPVAAPHSQ
jgi:hypothetical protein